MREGATEIVQGTRVLPLLSQVVAHPSSELDAVDGELPRTLKAKFAEHFFHALG
jgi:hypothetical protein